jgi:pimeloyl-ACP methyl ester carboxylesterase
MTAENTANPAAPNTIVLIHGLWMTPLSWEHWIDRYEARGFRVLTLAWPGMDGDIDELRSDLSGIDHLGIQEIVDTTLPSSANSTARRSSWATRREASLPRSCLTTATGRLVWL